MKPSYNLSILSCTDYLMLIFRSTGRMFSLRIALKRTRHSFGQCTIMLWQLTLGITESSQGYLMLVLTVILTPLKLGSMHSMTAHMYKFLSSLFFIVFSILRS
jgi:hypothetical protein